MNTAFYSPTPAPVLFRPVHPSTSITTSLSVGQLLDVELGLFLLSQLLPTAPPNALPALMVDAGASFPERSAWTAKQHKYLNRGRALLAHCLQPATWNALVERYAAGATTLSAYDVSQDRSRFIQKTVGFSRNRLTVLRKMLA